MGPADMRAMEAVWIEEQERRDYRSGALCALVANLFRDKDCPPARPEDFMPHMRRRREPTTPEQFEAQLRAAVIALGGEIRE